MQYFPSFWPKRLAPNTKLSPRELHMNVEINSQAQDKLPQRGFTCYVTKLTLHISCAWRRQRTPPPPPKTSGVWMEGGGGKGGGVSLESNCNEPGTYPEQMAGRDVWRGRVHLTSRCQISPPRFEQYSYKRQCGMDGFIKVSLHSETFTAAAATRRKKGQSVCERWREGSLKKYIYISKTH